MICAIPSDAELWEVVGSLQVCQAKGVTEVECDVVGEARDLMLAAELYVHAGHHSGLALHTTPNLLKIADAYRAMDKENRPYPDVLAAVSGLGEIEAGAPHFRNFAVSACGGIVFSPFEIQARFQLPWQVWRPVVRMLRTYGVDVEVLGRRGQRADYGPFTEGAVLSDLTVEAKLRALAAAKLVVGVPNEWTWIAAGLGKKVVVLHPDDIPIERWFGFKVEARILGRLLYSAKQLQVPVIEAGLRKLISVM